MSLFGVFRRKRRFTIQPYIFIQLRNPDEYRTSTLYRFIQYKRERQFPGNDDPTFKLYEFMKFRSLDEYRTSTLYRFIKYKRERQFRGNDDPGTSAHPEPRLENRRIVRLFSRGCMGSMSVSPVVASCDCGRSVVSCDRSKCHRGILKKRGYSGALHYVAKRSRRATPFGFINFKRAFIANGHLAKGN